MSSAQDTPSLEDIGLAFRHDAALQRRVLALAEKSSSNHKLISDIAQYILGIGGGLAINGEADGQANPKKRKLEEDGTNNTSILMSSPQKRDVKAQFELKEVSVSIPQRKKFHLELSNETILLRNPASGQVEVSEDIRGYAYALRLPVPEKTQKQYNYCLIPQYGEGLGRVNPDSHTFTETFLWTTNAGPPKTAHVLDPEWSKKLSSSGDRILDDALNLSLSAANIQVVEPDKSEFASATPEAHRKSETAYHVKAFRGSKDGFLFFLSTGIFFGFKKPLLFFPFDLINSISYTSVLQRTFNLVIAVSLPSPTSDSSQDPCEDSIEEFEFSMLDQADFAGIDAYIKRHQLSDASMAANRRAKKLNINKPAARKGPENGSADAHADGEEEGESELQKAQQQLEEEEIDEEDEAEEDYDPGSDGSSDGSGEDSDEDGYNDRSMRDVKGERDLVKDELGSEAEDVEVEEEEDDEEEEPEGDVEDDDDAEAPASAKQQQDILTMQMKARDPHGMGMEHTTGPEPDDEDQL